MAPAAPRAAPRAAVLGGLKIERSGRKFQRPGCPIWRKCGVHSKKGVPENHFRRSLVRVVHDVKSATQTKHDGSATQQNLPPKKWHTHVLPAISFNHQRSR